MVEENGKNVTTMPTVTEHDLDTMPTRADYGGFGYLHHTARSGWSDKTLLVAAERLRFTVEQVFEWANSRSARHFMDDYGRWFSPSVEDFERALKDVW